MREEEIFDKVKGILLSKVAVAPDAVTPEARLKEDLEVDSLDMVEMAMALEDEFSIKVPDDAIAVIQTVADVVEFVRDSLSVMD
jgi:acyl carrier protein